MGPTVVAFENIFILERFIGVTCKLFDNWKTRWRWLSIANSNWGIILPFQVTLSLIPPPHLLGGWPAFALSLLAIGALTALVFWFLFTWDFKRTRKIMVYRCVLNDFLSWRVWLTDGRTDWRTFASVRKKINRTLLQFHHLPPPHPFDKHDFRWSN